MTLILSLDKTKAKSKNIYRLEYSKNDNFFDAESDCLSIILSDITNQQLMARQYDLYQNVNQVWHKIAGSNVDKDGPYRYKLITKIENNFYETVWGCLTWAILELCNVREKNKDFVPYRIYQKNSSASTSFSPPIEWLPIAGTLPTDEEEWEDDLGILM